MKFGPIVCNSLARYSARTWRSINWRSSGMGMRLSASINLMAVSQSILPMHSREVNLLNVSGCSTIREELENDDMAARRWVEGFSFSFRKKSRQSSR